MNNIINNPVIPASNADVDSIIDNYINEFPDKNYMEIAQKIFDKGETNLSIRSLRRHAERVTRNSAAFQQVINFEPPLQEEIMKDANVPDLTETSEFLELNMSDNIVDENIDENVDNDIDDILLLNEDNFIEADVVEPKPKFTRNPKILLLDIETAPMRVYSWSTGSKISISNEQIIDKFFILGWAAKWLYSPETLSSFVSSSEAKRRDDLRIMKAVWKLLDDADVVITHNGIKFDIPKLKNRFIENGILPFSSVSNIDTYKIAKELGFDNNSLSWISKCVASKTKLKTDYQLWKDCSDGDPKALLYMEGYCKQDVGVLEEVYTELRPWTKSHPNLGVLMQSNEPCCPNCGSFDISEIGNYYTTPQNAYVSVRCNVCGAVNRTKTSAITSEQHANMIVPAAH